MLAGGDVGAEGFGVAFHGLGGHFQPGQQFELFAALLEGGFAACQGDHAAHARRALGPLHIQFPVARALSLMTVRAAVIGSLEADRSHHGGELFGARVVIGGLRSAGAGHLARRRLRARQ